MDVYTTAGIIFIVALFHSQVLCQDAAAPGRMCFVCSGKFPDRDCELYPQYVTMGPGKIQCDRTYCSTIVRYKPKKYLLSRDPATSQVSTLRPLKTEDFEVDSIARECEDMDRGNSCEMDGDSMAITCHEACTTELCNDRIPSPQTYTVKQPEYTSPLPPVTEAQPDRMETTTLPTEEVTERGKYSDYYYDYPDKDIVNKTKSVDDYYSDNIKPTTNGTSDKSIEDHDNLEKQNLEQQDSANGTSPLSWSEICGFLVIFCTGMVRKLSN